MLKLLLGFGLFVLAVLVHAVPWARAEPTDAPVELGAVPWLRDFDAGAKEARAADKPLQAARVNTLVGEHEDPTPLLAPAQRALLARIRAQPDAGWEDAIGVDLRAAWKRAALRGEEPATR